MPTRRRQTGGSDRTLLNGVTLPLVYSREAARAKPTAYWAVAEAGITLRQAAKYERMLLELTKDLKKRLVEGRN